MYQLLEDGARTGKQPWARIYALDHGKHWEQAAEYVKTHLKEWELALVKRDH